MSDASYAGLSAHNVVLYTRRGCHLCDEALQTLQQHGLEPICIDIDDDPTLRNKFDACVPVVEIDGRVRFRGARSSCVVAADNSGTKHAYGLRPESMPPIDYGVERTSPFVFLLLCDRVAETMAEDAVEAAAHECEPAAQHG